MFDFFKRMGAKAKTEMIKGVVKEYITTENVSAALQSFADFQSEKEAEAGAPLFVMAYRDDAGKLVMAVHKHVNGKTEPYTSFTLTGPEDILKIIAVFLSPKTEAETNDSEHPGYTETPQLFSDEHGQYIWQGERKHRIGTVLNATQSEPTESPAE